MNGLAFAVLVVGVRTTTATDSTIGSGASRVCWVSAEVIKRIVVADW